jgi:uncharacterized protein YuzE
MIKEDINGKVLSDAEFDKLTKNLKFKPPKPYKIKDENGLEQTKTPIKQIIDYDKEGQVCGIYTVYDS